MSLTDLNCKVVYVAAIVADTDDPRSAILKLAAKLDTGIFSVWIKPPKSSTTSWKFRNMEIKYEQNEMFVEKKRVASVMLKTALLMFHAFLKSSPVPVLLVDYSARNVSSILLTLFNKTGLVDLFHDVIVGFTHALATWSQNLPFRRNNVDFQLSALSRDYLRKDYTTHPYNTTDHLLTIAELAITISSESQLIKNRESYGEASAQYWNNSKIYRGLEPLLSTIPEKAIREMAKAQISYPVLEQVFRREGAGGLKKFLPQQESIRQLLVANDHEILVNIISHFSTRQGPY